jgi:membrane protease YdiL (CAAX protease family)
MPLRSIAVLVSAQALLLPISAFLAKMMNIPNYGLGAGFSLTSGAAVMGVQWTAPLFAIAGIMRLIEPYSPALQGVTKATQRSVLAVLGKERRPAFALLVSILLGGVAGWGEEWLFRGVFQTMLTERFSSRIGLAVSGVVFGSLHAVTPVYALLAALASFFFGYLYNVSGNLAVPMICHAVYDVGALMWAHWSATDLPSWEQDEILESGPLAPIMDAGQINSSSK